MNKNRGDLRLSIIWVDFGNIHIHKRNEQRLEQHFTSLWRGKKGQFFFLLDHWESKILRFPDRLTAWPFLLWVSENWSSIFDNSFLTYMFLIKIILLLVLDHHELPPDFSNDANKSSWLLKGFRALDGYEKNSQPYEEYLWCYLNKKNPRLKPDCSESTRTTEKNRSYKLSLNMVQL